MNRAFLIALREFLEAVRSKSFWLTMILVPLLALGSGLLSSWLRDNRAQQLIVIIDQSSLAAPALVEALDEETARRGQATFGIVPAPEGIDANAAPEEIGASLAPWLDGDRKLADGRQLYGAIIVPRDFSFVAEGAGPPAQVQVWSANPADSGLQSFVAATLTEEARRRYLMALGLDALTLENMNAMAVSVAPYAATRSGGVAAVSLADRLSGLLPMGLSFLLWISILIVGNRLLTGVIEERASKVMEVLLSSATPGEILSGKLIGIGMVGLSIIFVWLVSLIGATFVAEGELAEFGRRIISEFFSSGLIFFFLFYFTLGFAMQASLFLGVGAISNTLNDAQSYLTPLMIILVAPFAVLVEVQRDPSGMLAQVMSWIPFSTPVVMMVRAPAGAAWWEILGTGIVLIISTIFVIWLMARLFRAAMLRTGQPPRLAELARLIWRGSAAG